MKLKRLVPILVVFLALLFSAVPALAGGTIGTNWRVYNLKPATSSWWDINKPLSDKTGGYLFPIQKFQTTSSGSFVVYFINNYNGNITGKTLSANMSWTSAPGAYTSRSGVAGDAYVRFEFQDVTASGYLSNDYWWSTGSNSLDLNAASSGTLTVPLTDRTLWSNMCGKRADDTNTYAGPNCVGGTDPAVSPYDGFTYAMKNVKQVGLAFGRASAYSSGVALSGTTGAFHVASFTIQ